MITGPRLPAASARIPARAHRKNSPMNYKTVALALVFAALSARATPAAAPQISDIAPFGAQRGLITELTISGANLKGNPRLIAPFNFRPQGPARDGDGSTCKLKLEVDPEVAVGNYAIRIQTDDGISNPFLLAVGQLPQVAEKEENSVFELAQQIPEPPLVVEGRVPDNDVDFFRFRGRKGQKIVIDAQCARIGSGIDPTIRLTKASANRAYVASADDTPGLLTDARLVAELPEDTDYVVEISDSRYQGAGRPVYRLLIGAVPMAEEVYPLGGRGGETLGLELRGGMLGKLAFAATHLDPRFGTDLFQPRVDAAAIGWISPAGMHVDLESLPPLVVSDYVELREPALASAAPVRAVAPVVFNGRIDPQGDEDRFALAVAPGSRLRIKVQAYELGSALDAVLRVEGNSAAVIASADDTTIPLPPRNGVAQALTFPDPTLEMTVPGGTTDLVVVIRDLEHRGGVGFPYRIVVEPLAPDFELQVNDAQVSVPLGGTATVGVAVKRKGYTGPITVTVPDPPAGLSVRPGTIPSGQTIGVLSLSATPLARFPAAPMALVATGQGPGAGLKRLATKTIVFAQQTNLPTSATTLYGLVVAPARPTAVTVDAPSAPIEVAQGFGATVPVTLIRSKGADAGLAVSALPLPPGLTVPAAKIAEKATEGQVRVQAALDAALGLATIGLQAKGSLAGGEQIVAVPAVTVNVVRPAAVELAAPAIEIKPGASTEVKGKIVRKGSFNEPVTVRLNGLPTGLKADAVTVPPGSSSFALKVSAEKSAPATKATGQVVVAFQVQKKDYPVPPTPVGITIAAPK
jgi:hypothetical protein